MIKIDGFQCWGTICGGRWCLRRASWSLPTLRRRTGPPPRNSTAAPAPRTKQIRPSCGRVTQSRLPIESSMTRVFFSGPGRVSFGRYVTQIVSTGQREAHERRLKRLQDEARELHKNEWMFTPVDRLLGNWVEWPLTRRPTPRYSFASSL